jgi:DNA-binding GntR family transcriptional regulator
MRVDVQTRSEAAGQPSAAERAYRHTKERILSGELLGGSMVTEGDVSSALGISRTPVREGFLRLQAEGLLQLHPKRGALVVPVSPGEVGAVLEARELLENHAPGKLVAGILTELYSSLRTASAG